MPGMGAVAATDGQREHAEALVGLCGKDSRASRALPAGQGLSRRQIAALVGRIHAARTRGELEAILDELPRRPGEPDRQPRFDLDFDQWALPAASQARRYASVHASDVFAWVYLDPVAGEVRVGLVSGAERHLRELRARIAQPERLRCFRARYTTGQLDAVHARVDGDWDELADRGPRITTTATDIQDNVVDIGRANPSPAALLNVRYGPAVRMFEEPMVLVPRAGGGAARGAAR